MTNAQQPKPFFDQARDEAAAMVNSLATTFPELRGCALVFVWDPQLGDKLPGCIIAGQHGKEPSAQMTFDLLLQLSRISMSLHDGLRQTFVQLGKASEELAKKLNEQTQQLAGSGGAADDGKADAKQAGGEPPAAPIA